MSAPLDQTQCTLKCGRKILKPKVDKSGGGDASRLRLIDDGVQMVMRICNHCQDLVTWGALAVQRSRPAQCAVEF